MLARIGIQSCSTGVCLGASTRTSGQSHWQSRACRRRGTQRRLVVSNAKSKEEELKEMEAYKEKVKLGIAQALKDAAAQAAASPAPADDEEDLPEITGETFWPTIKGHSDGMAVVMCYTNSCVPCKAAKPNLIQWSKDLKGEVAFYKFALTLPNKERALEFGVKTSPAFMIFKKGHLLDILRGGAAVPMLKQVIWLNK